MNKLNLCLLFLIGSLVSNVYALAPEPPHLNLERSGLLVKLNWDSKHTASGYRLHYATYPEVNNSGNVDVKEQTSFTISLANGTGFYTWVTAYNADGESLPSNIESIVIDQRVIAFLPESSTGEHLLLGLKEVFTDISSVRLETIFADSNDTKKLKSLFFGRSDINGYSSDPDVLAVITATTGQTLALTSKNIDNPPLVISCTGTATQLKSMDNILTLPANNEQQAKLMYSNLMQYAKTQQRHVKYAILLNRRSGIALYGYDLYVLLLSQGLSKESEIQEKLGLDNGQPTPFAQLVGTFLFDSSPEEMDTVLAQLDVVQPDIVLHIGYGSDLPSLIAKRPNFIWAGGDSAYVYETYQGKDNVALVMLNGGVQDYGYDAGLFLKEVLNSLSDSLLTRKGVLDSAKHIVVKGRTGKKGFNTGNEKGNYDLIIPGPTGWIKLN